LFDLTYDFAVYQRHLNFIYFIFKEVFILIGIAYAMGTGGSAASGSTGGFTSFIPLILMFVIFYFLLIRPQQKKTKQHQEVVNNLKTDDKIITSGGIYGKITAVTDTTLTVEIADRVRIKIARGNVAGLIGTQNQNQPVPKNKSK